MRPTSLASRPIFPRPHRHRHRPQRARTVAGLVCGLVLLGPGGAADAATAASAASAPVDAVAAIDAQLAARPNDAQLLFRRGVALSAAGRASDAAAVFRRLIDTHPDLAAAYNNLAVIVAGEGDYAAAQQLLDKAVRLKTDYGKALHNLGDVHLQLAAAAYGDAAQADGTDLTARRQLAALQPLLSNAAASAPARMPAVAAAPAVAATAQAAAASTPAARAASASTAVAVASATAVEAVLRSWADDWSRRDVDAYLGHYAPTFQGRAASAAAWRAGRRARLTQPKTIRVALSDIVVHADGERATARFRQDYASDRLHTVDRKELTLQRDPAGQWLITGEAIGH